VCSISLVRNTVLYKARGCSVQISHMYLARLLSLPWFPFSQTTAKTWCVCTYTVLHRPSQRRWNRGGKVVLAHAMLKPRRRKYLSPAIKCQIYQLVIHTQFCRPNSVVVLVLVLACQVLVLVLVLVLAC